MENEEILGRDSKVSAVLGPMYCLAADVAALLRRSAVRTKGYLKRAVKKLLPEFALDIIRRTRQNALLRQQRRKGSTWGAERPLTSECCILNQHKDRDNRNEERSEAQSYRT